MMTEAEQSDSPTTSGTIPLLLSRDEKNVDWLPATPIASSNYDLAARQYRSQIRQTNPAKIIQKPLSSLHPGLESIRTPDLLIFHTSRCGSTLLTEILSQLEGSVVIAESSVSSILLKKTGDTEQDLSRAGYYKGFLHHHGMLAKPGRFFVKLDCDHILQIEALRGLFPHSPCLFLFRHPLEIMMSHQRSLGAPMIPPAEAYEKWKGYGSEDARNLHQLYVVERLKAFLNAAIEHRVPSLEYTELQAENVPAVLAKCGVDARGDELSRIRPVFDCHSKYPQLPFTSDRDEKRKAASPLMHELCSVHLEQLYQTCLIRAKEVAVATVQSPLDHHSWLREWTGKILKAENAPGVWQALSNEYLERCQRILGMDTHALSNDASSETYLPTGKAISPLEAARCTWQGTRTAKFIQGVARALRSLHRQFPDESLRVLYAGCGPLAPLLLPPLSLEGMERLEVTFLDIHPESLGLAQSLATAFNLNPSRHRWLQKDAAAFAPESDTQYHLIVTEVMQQALRREPQVAVTRNLAHHLHPEGIFIPEEITLSFGWFHPGKHVRSLLNPESMQQHQWLQVMGEVFALSPKIARQWPLDALQLAGKTISISPPPDSNWEARIFTDIRVYEELNLTLFDCSLNMPEPIGPIDSRSEQLSFLYEISTQPGLRPVLPPS